MCHICSKRLGQSLCKKDCPYTKKNVNNTWMASGNQNPATLIANLLVPFAEAASISMQDSSGTLRKRLLLSLQFADVERMHETLFPGEHLDWQVARTYIADTSLGTDEWMALIALLHFNHAEPFTRPEVSELLTAASAGMRISMQGKDLNPLESMQLCFARAGASPLPSWDTICKALLLTNLADVDVQAALTRLLLNEAAAVTTQKKKTPSAIVEAVLKHLHSCKHSRDDYGRTFAQILSANCCHVATHAIIRSLRCREEVQTRIRQNALAILRGAHQPSLSRILEEKQRSASSLLGEDQSFSRSSEQLTSTKTSTDKQNNQNHHHNNNNKNNNPFLKKMNSNNSSSSNSNSTADIDKEACDTSGAKTRKFSNPQSRICSTPFYYDGKSFKHFCHAIRLSENMGRRIRMACYYIASIQHALYEDKAGALRVLLAGIDENTVRHAIQAVAIPIVPMVRKRTTTNSNQDATSDSDNDGNRPSDPPPLTVTSPESAVLRAFVAEAHHAGAPCPALVHFRQHCLNSTSRTNGMTWTIVLRLYLAAYCVNPLNKELWAQHIPEITNAALIGGPHHHGTSTVQTYVRTHPPALVEIAPLLLLTSSY